MDSSPAKSLTSTPRISPRRNPRQEFSKSDESHTLTPSPGNSDSFPLSYQCKRNPNSNSVCSEISLESKEDPFSVDSSLADEDSLKDNISKLSSSCKSQTDSGIGVDISTQAVTSHCNHAALSQTKANGYNKANENHVKNNEKDILPGSKPSRVGVHVNDLNSCNDNTLATNETSDNFTSEEKLIAMLNRNKLHAKVKDKEPSGIYLVYFFCLSS